MKKRLLIILSLSVIIIILIYNSSNYKIYKFLSKDSEGICDIYKNNNRYVVKFEKEYFHVRKKGFASRIDRPLFENNFFLIYDSNNFEGLSMAEFNNSKETLIKNGKIYFWIHTSVKKNGITLQFNENI